MTQQSLEERSSQSFAYGKFQPDTFSTDNQITAVGWNTDEGRKWLFESQYADDFYRLAHFYQPQINPVYCGVASAVIVLNALSQPVNSAPDQKPLAIPIPERDQSIPFQAYSQITFLGKNTDSVKSKSVIEYRHKNENGVYKPGLSLLELKGLIAAYQFKVAHHFPAESKINAEAVDKFRTVLKNTIRSDRQHIVIHFRADMLGGLSKGHISPLAAYHDASDSVLILDVAGHKGPWFWAPIESVLKAMATTYDTQPKGGGYLIISPP